MARTTMYKYLQNFSVKNIILFAVVIFSFIIFAGTIIYLSIKVREGDRKDSKTIIDKNTGVYAQKIEGMFSSALGITRTLANSFIENRDSTLNKLNPVNKKILFSSVDCNPDFLSIWLNW